MQPYILRPLCHLMMHFVSSESLLLASSFPEITRPVALAPLREKTISVRGGGERESELLSYASAPRHTKDFLGMFKSPRLCSNSLVRVSSSSRRVRYAPVVRSEDFKSQRLLRAKNFPRSNKTAVQVNWYSPWHDARPKVEPSQKSPAHDVVFWNNSCTSLRLKSSFCDATTSRTVCDGSSRQHCIRTYKTQHKGYDNTLRPPAQD